MVQLLDRPVLCSDNAFLNTNLSSKVALKCVLFRALLLPSGLAVEIYWERENIPIHIFTRFN